MTAPRPPRLPPLPGDDGLTIRTARIELRPLTRAHAPGMLPLLQDPGLYTFTGNTPPEDLEGLTRLYAFWEGRVSPDGDEYWLNWVVQPVGEANLIGHVQATVTPGHAWLAWVIGTPWQGRGYATEAACALVAWLTAFGTPEFRASIHPENEPSIRVAERAGLRRTDGESDGERVWVLRS